MGPHAVVDRPPAIECSLHLVVIGVVASGDYLNVESPVEALDLAVRLWMVWLAMSDSHAKTDHPDRQLGEPMFNCFCSAPRRPVVDIDLDRQPVALEHGL